MDKRPRGNVFTFLRQIDTSTDEGRAAALKGIAEECLVGAARLRSNFPDLAEYILAAHALEVALKAFLAKQGVTDAELRRTGHDLVALHDMARREGLSVQHHQANAIIDWLNEYHNYGARLRYDATQNISLPNTKMIFSIIREVLDFLE
jgi:hypothetical protein